jgi:hypothetical protein
MRYRILDCDGNLIAKAGSLAKAEKAAAEYAKAHGYGSPGLMKRRYCFLEPDVWGAR